MSKLNRRKFLKISAAGAALGLLPKTKVAVAAGSLKNDTPGHAVVIASGNGAAATARAMELLKSGSDPLDAVIAGVNIVENDPEDITVGYGGLPNELGVVQLDASVMHGPTHNAGAVACLEGVKNPSLLAKVVMERTDHVLLVGKGARDFARAHGYKIEELLTEKSRKIWLHWKENLSEKDDWFSSASASDVKAEIENYKRHWGTINCCALTANGDLAGVTTTSGLAYKIAGRVGDSPIIGAGLYVDNEVGAAGSTGRGEANLKNLSSFMVVEFMRQGKSPTEACLAMCERIAKHTKLPHLLKSEDRPNFNVNFYAVNKRGEVGGASILSGAKMCVVDREGARTVDIPYLFTR